MCRAKEISKTIIEVLSEIEEIYNGNYEQIGNLDKARGDILHAIEWDKSVDVQKGYKYAKKLQEISRERRQLKDENETLYLLYDIATKEPAFRIVLNKFKKAEITITRKLEGMKNRTYVPRIENGLEVWNKLDNIKEVV